MGFKKLERKLRKNKTLYFYAKMIRRWGDKDFRNWVMAYGGPDAMLVKHPGKINPEEFIYCIRSCQGGFFAEVMIALGCLRYADTFHLTPVIDWSSNCIYSEPEPVNGTSNVFEYYFKPVAGIRYMDIERYKNVIYASLSHRLIMSPDWSWENLSYQTRPVQAEKFGLLYKKYFILNQETQKYIDNNIKNKLCGKKTLGVHVRQTDFKKKLDGHPVCLDTQDFIRPAKELLEKHGYEQIFLATDSLEAVELFRKEFGSMLVYYEDVMRSDGDVGIHCLENERKNHHYLLGLEVLRDAYTLAACDSLLAGMSNVSFAAQYVKIAEGAEHEEVKILDHGLNHNNRVYKTQKTIRRNM